MTRHGTSAVPLPHVHIFLLGPSPTPVGGYKVAYEYANSLVAAGRDVTVWHSTAFFAEMAAKGRRIKRAKAVVRSLLTRFRMRRAYAPWMLVDPRVSMRLTSGLPRPTMRSGDLVIATAVETTRHAARVASKSGATSMALVQHFETWAAPEDAILRTLRSVDIRVVIAPWLGDILRDGGLDSELIPNAVDSAGFPLGPNVAERGPFVLTLLSPHAYKRPDVVMAALEKIHRERPDVVLTAFGQSERPAMLHEAVRYVKDPDRHELIRLYQSARIYFCGSDAEGWHLPPAEATLSGAPVVSTDIGGVRVSMEDDALYVRPGSGDALGEAVLQGLSDTIGSQERVDRARARLMKRTYASNTTELLDLVARVRVKK